MKDTNLNLLRWAEHFRRNQEGRDEPEWEAEITLAPEVVRKLLPSLAQFELGDGGGPAYLIAWNRERFLAQPGARELVDLWFKEEEEHSRLLGDMLSRLGGEKVEGHWSFSIFCAVRKLLGVAFELRTLLLTEIVSNVYYKLLLKHGADKDVALAQMCRLVIRDETGHIAFHRDRLRRNRTGFGLLWRSFFRLMGLAAGTMLWVNHRSAVIALGGSTREFYRGILGDMTSFLRSLRTSKHRQSEPVGHGPHPQHN